MKSNVQGFCFLLFLIFIFKTCAICAEPQMVDQDKKVEKPRTIALITFETMPGDIKENQWIGAGFAESVSVKLAAAEYPLLSVYERRKLNLTLKNAGISQSDLSYSSPAAVEKIAKAVNSAGVDLLLMGSFQFTGLWNEKDAHYEFNGSVIDTATGKMLPGMALSLSGRVDSTGKELFDAHSNMARLIIKSLGIEVTSAKNVSYLEDPLTDSLAAYREYILGLESKDRGEFEDAIKYFKSATTISDSFIKALIAKGETYEEMYSGSEKAVQKAVGEKWDKDTSNDVALLDAASAAAHYNRAKFLVTTCKTEDKKSKCSEAIVELDKFDSINENKVMFWKFKHGKYLLGQPVEKDGIIYFNSCTDGNYHLVIDGGFLRDCKNITLYAIDENTGKEKWNFKYKGNTYPPPAIDENIVYTSSCEQPDNIGSILLCNKATLYAIEKNTGRELKKYTEAMTVFSAVYLTDTLLFIKTSTRLKVFSKTSGEKLNEMPIGLFNSNNVSENNSGIYLFNYKSANRVKSGSWNFDKTVISKIDKSSGIESWKNDNVKGYFTAPIFDDGYFYVTSSLNNADSSNSSDLNNWEFHKYDLNTGKKEWTDSFKNAKRLYCLSRDNIENDLFIFEKRNDMNILYRIDKQDGKIIWQKTIEKNSGSFFFTNSEEKNIFYKSYDVNGINNKLITICKQTGNEEWSFDSKEDIYKTFVVKGTDIYVYTYVEDLFCIEKSSGNVKWKKHMDHSISNFYFIDEMFFTVTNGFFFAYDKKTGIERWRYEISSSPFGNNFYTYGNKLFLINDTIYALGLQQGSTGPVDLDADLLRTESLLYLDDYESGKKVLINMLRKKPNNLNALEKLVEICEMKKNILCLLWARPNYYKNCKIKKECNDVKERIHNLDTNIVNSWIDQLPLNWKLTDTYYEFPFYLDLKPMSFNKNIILWFDHALKILDKKTGLITGTIEPETKSGSVPEKNIDVFYGELPRFNGLFAANANNATLYWAKEIEMDNISQAKFVLLDKYLMTKSSDVIKIIDKKDGATVTEYPYKRINELSYFIPSGDNIIGSKFNDNHIFAFSALDGNMLWNIENSRIHNICGDVFIYDSMRELIGIDVATGKVLWSNKFKEREEHPNMLSCDSHGNSIYVSGNGYIYKINITTGAESWNKRRPVEGYIDYIILYNESSVLGFSNENTLYSMNAGTGELKYPKVRIDGSLIGRILHDKYLILETNDYKLIVLNQMTGDIIWSLQMFGYSRLEIFEDNLIINPENQIFSIDLKKAEQMVAEGKKWWMD